MKETKEFLDSLVGTSAQAIESFADGAQVTDAADFFDDALGWPEAIKGFKDGFPKEAKEATPDIIETMFNGYAGMLNKSGLDPLLTGSIISGMKGAYYTYAALMQKKEAEQV